MLRELGIGPLWRLRSSADEVQPEPVAPAARAAAVPHGGKDVLDEIPRTPVARASSNAPAHASAKRPAPEASGIARPQPVQTGPAVDPTQVATLGWEALEQTIAECRACALHVQRHLTVPGSGDRQARLMLVGEGPGAEEDKRGQPFVGAAGELLDAMLAAIGLNREQGVYIANAVKCRPPFNRTPHEDEITACSPYLARQIQLVKPDLIIALGRQAAQRLLGQEVRINAARGRMWRFGDAIPLIVTYHPAYLLRNPADKAKAWTDLCLVRRHLDEKQKKTADIGFETK